MQKTMRLTKVLILLAMIPIVAMYPARVSAQGELPEEIILNIPDSGQQNYVATMRVRLEDGYSFYGSDAGSMYAFVDTTTIDSSLIDSTLFSPDLSGNSLVGTIEAIEYVDEGSVKLRWLVSEYNTWLLGNAEGYELTRMTTHVNDTALTGQEMEDSRIVLADDLKPLELGEWNLQFPNNEMAILARNLLYMQYEDQIPGDGLDAAVFKKESENTRHIFSLFAADQDFDIAKAMGLGYEDLTISNNNKYMYLISINTDNQSYQDIMKVLTVDATINTPLDTLHSVAALGTVDQIELQWDPRPTEGVYTSYDIERSSDNNHFTRLNAEPYVNLSTPDANSPFQNFIDEVDDYETYYYRVRGRNAFGDHGPYSAVVSAHAKPPRQDIFFHIDSCQITEPDATIRWDNLESIYSDQITGFNVLTCDQSDGIFTAVNTSVLSPSIRSFMLTNVPGAVYAIVEAVDEYGYSYKTPAYLVQLPDDEPPAIPDGLIGEFVSESTVVINWAESPSPDLLGYRVFVANQRNGSYTQLTGRPLVDEQFVYEVNPETMIDSIYFTVAATDYHENLSEESEVLALSRPDIIPPTPPALFKAHPTTKGVELGWRFSTSKDVTKHVVQRKQVGTASWDNILEISKVQESDYHENLSPEDITATCYIDEEVFDRKQYEYRMIAYDEMDNNATSDAKIIRPLDTGLRGLIEGFNVSLKCEPADPGNLPNQQGYDTLTAILKQYEMDYTIDFDQLLQLVFFGIITQEEYNDLIEQEPRDIYDFLSQRKIDYWKDNIVAEIFLMWEYTPTKFLQDFQIFKSAANSPMQLYETIPIESLTDYVFKDDEAIGGNNYIYQILARHSDGGFSKMSDPLIVRVPRM